MRSKVSLDEVTLAAKANRALAEFIDNKKISQGDRAMLTPQSDGPVRRDECRRHRSFRRLHGLNSEI